MQHLTACLVCGATAMRDVVWYKPDPYFRRLPGLRDARVTYQACAACGFVFQNPTLDPDEIEALYALEYRHGDPPEDYQRRQRVIAEQIVRYVAPHAPSGPGPRRVLDIGSAAGLILHAFKRRGWTATGLDANARWNDWGRRHLGVDLRTGFYDERALPGERFQVVLFSHVVEHVPDPYPLLRAIRNHLSEDGVLFLGAPNVLRPHPPYVSTVLAGPHVCLYSSRTIVRLLNRAGFEVVFLDNWYPRGLRVIARPAPPVTHSPRWQSDNWKIIHHLYQGLLRPGEGSVLQRNLAGLVPKHFEVLEEVSRQGILTGHRIVKEQGRVVNVEIETARGLRTLLEPRGAGAGRGTSAPPSPPFPPRALIVQIGIGLGRGALALAGDLEGRDQRLLICEPDPAIVLAALMTTDLRALLASPRVKLVTGAKIRISRDLRAMLKQPRPLVVTQDPPPHRLWAGRYDQIAAYFRSGEWRHQSLQAWEFTFAA